MTKDLLTDAVMREFLLDQLDDSAREEIENLFLTDAQARELLLSAEQDLIEDYLEDSLTPADKETFVKLHAQTEAQRENLRNTKTIKEWALTARRSGHAADHITVSIWPQIGARLGIKPIYLVAFAATIMVAIALAIVWANSRMEQRKHLAIEQELAQLNSPDSLRQIPSDLTSLELQPVTVRSVEAQPEYEPTSAIQVLELHLRWTAKERYPTYQAEVISLGDNQSLSIPNLQPDKSSTIIGAIRPEDVVPLTIRLRLPVRLVHRGNYRITLSGISADGTRGLTQEYNFAVRY